MPVTATKPAPADPLDAAEASQESARSEAADITEQINDLLRGGPPVDDLAHQRLKSAQETAFKKLRHADLAVEEQRAAATAPISARALSKIRVMRRKTHDAHAALIVRLTEARHLRERKSSLESQIAAATSSGAFKQAQKDIKSRFVYGREDQEHPEPPSNQKMPPSVEQLARLERALAVAIAELAIAAKAQGEAQARWESAEGTLESWESAIRSQGPAARRALAEIPAAGAHDSQGLNPGAADIETGRGAFSTRGMAS